MKKNNKNEKMRSFNAKSVLLIGLCLGATGLLWGCFQSQKYATEEFVIAVPDQFKPFEVTNRATGELSGIDVDLARALCAQTKHRCTIRAYRAEELATRLRSGEITFVVTALRNNGKSDMREFYSATYFRAKPIFFTRREAFQELKDRGDCGARIGVIAHTQAEFDAKRFASEAKERKTVSSFASMVDLAQALRLSEIDSAYVNNKKGLEFMKTPEGDEFRILFDCSWKNPYREEIRIVMRQGDSDLINDINQAILVLKTQTWAQISADKIVPGLQQ